MPPIRRSTRKARGKLAVKKPKSDKPLPLVERTNKLSLEEFMTLYIPPEELKFQKTKFVPNPAIKDVNKEEIHAQGEQEETTATDSYILDIYTAATIPTADFDACFKLIELTSSHAYKNSSMRWSPAEKKKEMKLPDMKYIILRRTEASNGADRLSSSEVAGPVAGEVLGFLEFMVTYEDGKEVIYCYEIHLMLEVQRQRLGEELMRRFERIGQRIGLEKAMLTVFKSNTRAQGFYNRVGYTEDEYSPRSRRLRNGTVKEADYRILSKSLESARQ